MKTTKRIRYTPVANQRKATIRRSPNWLDALDLSSAEPLPRTYPTPRTRQVEVEIDVSDLVVDSGKNAAELWAESLPDFAIYAERRARHERVYEVAAPELQPVAVKLHPHTMPKHRSALGDACRNAGLLAILAAALTACVHYL